MATFTGVNAKDFDSQLVICFSDLKSAQKGLNKLVASAIYIALVDKNNRGLEANKLLARLEEYRTGESAVLRRFLMKYGPFVKGEEDKRVKIGNNYFDVKYAVKYSETLHKNEFSDADPEAYYGKALIVSYFEYKKGTENKKSKETEEKDEEEKLLELQDAFRKMVKKAKKDGIPLEAIDQRFAPVEAKVEVEPSNLPFIIKQMLADAATCGKMQAADIGKLRTALSILEADSKSVAKAA